MRASYNQVYVQETAHSRFIDNEYAAERADIAAVSHYLRDRIGPDPDAAYRPMPRYGDGRLAVAG